MQGLLLTSPSGALLPLLPTLKALLERSSSLPLDLSIKIFYTRAVTAEDMEKYMAVHDFPAGLSLTSGRAWIPQILTDLVDRTSAALSQESGSSSHGVIVGTCGPAGLSDDARRAIRIVGKAEKKAVGGIELHEE